MPNRLQLAFIASFVLTFSTLFITSRFINAKLKAAGYDISELILIGLPKNSTLTDDYTTNSNIIDNMGQASTPFLDGFKEIVSTQVLALVFAVISSVFIFVKFAAASGCLFHTCGWPSAPSHEGCMLTDGSFQGVNPC